MKWTCHVKATVLLPSVFCLFLALCVSANPAERVAVLLPDQSRQSLSLGSPERLREQAVERGRSGDYQSAIDSRYEPKLGRYYYWMVWYPLVYWVLQAAATCVAVPKALLGGLKSRGTWTSPDRGIRTSKVS